MLDSIAEFDQADQQWLLEPGVCSPASCTVETNTISPSMIKSISLYIPIQAGRAAFLEANVWHEAGTGTGLTAIVIEGEETNPAELMLLE